MNVKFLIWGVCLSLWLLFVGFAYVPVVEASPSSVALTDASYGIKQNMMFASASTGSSSSSSSGQTATEGGGGGAWYIPEWVTDLMEKVDSMLQTFKDLMSGKLIYDAINGVVILWADDTVEPVLDLYSKSFLFSPQVAEMAFVQNAWSISMWISCAIMIVAIILMGFALVKGSKAPGPLLKNFAICFVLSLVSLTAINIINVGMNGFTAITMDSLVKDSGINYTNIQGDDVLKSMVAGSKALTDATFKEQSLTEMLAAEKGGIFTMFAFLIFTVDTMTVMTLIKLLALIGLAILSPLYISGAALIGRIDPVLGFLNVFVRTTAAGYLMSFYWGFSVKLQNDTINQQGWMYDLGIPSTLFISVMGLVVSFLLYRHWLKPLGYALSDPVTLGGGAVLEGFGNFGKYMGEFVSHVGSQFGIPGLQKVGSSWSDKSKQVADHGKRMREERERQMRDRSKGSRSYRQRFSDAHADSHADMTLEPPTGWIQSVEQLDDDDITPAQFKGLSLLDSGTSLQRTMNRTGFTQQTSVRLDPDTNEANISEWISKWPKALRNQVALDGQQLTIAGDPTAILKKLDAIELGYDVEASHYHKNGVTIQSDTGRVQADGSEASKHVLNQLASEEDTFQRVDLPHAEAKDAFNQAKKDRAEWTKHAELRDNGLWVHSDVIEEAMYDLGQSRGTTTSVMRVELPSNSRFLDDMLESWAASGQYTELISAIETGDSATELFVKADQYEAFEQAYDQYRKQRKPYWTTRSGDIKVIEDNIAITYGSVPTHGMDMGSFEKFAKQRHRKEDTATKVSAMPNKETKPDEAPHVWEAAITPIPAVIPNVDAAKTQHYPLPSQIQRPKRKLTLKSTERVNTATPPVEEVAKKDRQMIVTDRLPMRRAGDSSDAVKVSNVARPARLIGPNQPKRKLKAIPAPRTNSTPTPVAEKPVKNAAQKEVAKQAATDGMKAAVKSGAVVAGATLVSSGSLKTAASQGLKAGGKAGIQAAQKRVVKDGAKAVSSDSTKLLPKRGERKKK